jgi:hypothetical protein
MVGETLNGTAAWEPKETRTGTGGGAFTFFQAGFLPMICD